MALDSEMATANRRGSQAHDAGTVRAAVVQDGSRLHYAVPLAIQRAGCLERMYASWYAPPGSLAGMTARTLHAFGYRSAASMMHRYAAELDPALVRSNGWITLSERLFRRRFASDFDRHHWSSHRLGEWIKRRGFGHANALVGFTGNIDPILLAHAKECGLVTVTDQYITPFDIQILEDDLQHEKFPGWSSMPRIAGEAVWRTWENESWRWTDHHTCASEYVRDGLLKMGVEANRISVMPYPIDSSSFGFVDRSGRKGALKVGFVGGVGLRKGAPYFLEVAKRFSRQQAEFVMVGPIQLTPSVVNDFRSHVEVVGSVPRPDILRWLHQFDIFFFPTTCEGSAGAVMEAMATGLPIVTSPNAGSIVEHRKNGFLAPYADIEAHVEAIELLCRDEAARLAMGKAARAAAEACSIDAYSMQWKQLLGPLVWSLSGNASRAT